MFHDASDIVAINAREDAVVLTEAGFHVVWHTRTEGLHRAWVERSSFGRFSLPIQVSSSFVRALMRGSRPSRARSPEMP